MHHVAVAVETLAEGLHHQLLQIAAEHLETIAVGKHHHVALALAVAGNEPGRCHQRSRIATKIGHPRGFIHLGGTTQKLADIASDQCSWEQADGAGDAGPSADPVEHVEPLQPALLPGLDVELAVQHGDRDGLTRPLAAVGLDPVTGLFHAQVRFRRATGFAHRHHQRCLQLLSEGFQHGAHAVGIDVVEEVKRQTFPMALECPDHQKRAEAAAADADPEHIRERFPVGGLDGAAEHVLAERFDLIDLAGHMNAHLLGGGQLGMAQPVVTDLALLIGIRDRTGLQLLHRRKGLVEARLQLIEMGGVEMHPAHIKPESEIVVVPDQITKSLPLDLCIGTVEIRKTHQGLRMHSR